MSRGSLNALSVFAAVAEAGSFRAAARALGLSVAAVSEAVSTLEARHKLKLFNRTTRSLSLTDAGKVLLSGVQPALAAITEALDAAAMEHNRLTGTIRLSVPGSAAALSGLKVVLSFIGAYPDVQVELTAEDGLIDIVKHGYDAGVRLGEFLEQDMIAIPISPPQRGVLVASPAYLARHGVPDTPADLARHRCIGRRFTGGSIYRWELERDGRAIVVDPPWPLLLNDINLIITAALEGAGITYMFRDLVEKYLTEGRLVSLLDDWCPPYPGFYLYYPHRQLLRPPMRAFIDHVLRESRIFAA